MRKLIICLLIFSLSQNVHAQKNYRNIGKFGAFIGSLNLSYEHAFDKHSAVAVSPALGIFRSMGIRYSIAGAGAEYRYYFPFLHKTAPQGFYASPGIGYYVGNASYKTTNGSTIKSDIGGTAIKATAGFQHIFKSRVVLDINAGTQYIRLTFKGGGIFANDEAFTGFVPYVGVGVGYAFKSSVASRQSSVESR